MAVIRLGNLLWKDNTQPNSVSNPVNTKDVNSDAIKNKVDTLATETKLEQVRTLLAGVATEDKLEQARALLQTISGKDFATQTTLAQVKSELELVKAELQAIKANQLSGDQKVQLSGTVVEQEEVARDVIVTPGSEVIAYTDNDKLAAVALSVVVNAKTPHNFNFRVIERPASISGYPSIYFDTNLLSEGKSVIRMPKKALSANQRIQYRIGNSSDIDQSYAIARGLWYV